MNDFTDFLQKRRSTIISKMTNETISEADIETILACGVRVPDHAVLGPWKIIIIQKEARRHLGKTILRAEYAKQFPDANEESLIFEEKKDLNEPSVIFAVLSTPKEHPKNPAMGNGIISRCCVHEFSYRRPVNGIGCAMGHGMVCL